jgi:hypothetical protein
MFEIRSIWRCMLLPAYDASANFIYWTNEQSWWIKGYTERALCHVTIVIRILIMELIHNYKVIRNKINIMDCFPARLCMTYGILRPVANTALDSSPGGRLSVPSMVLIGMLRSVATNQFKHPWDITLYGKLYTILVMEDVSDVIKILFLSIEMLKITLFVYIFSY